MKKKKEDDMSLRKQARILGISHTYLSLLLTGKWKWSADLKERYEELVTTFVTTTGYKLVVTSLKFRCQTPLSLPPKHQQCVAYSQLLSYLSE